MTKITLSTLFVFAVVAAAATATATVVSGEHHLRSDAPPRDSRVLEMLRSSLAVFKSMRNEIGVYRDSASLREGGAGNEATPCSVASVGMALVSLTVAHAIGEADDAAAQVEQTLRAMAGKTPGFAPARNARNGFYRHFINMTTGEQSWNSEYSSIDTAIMVAGGLFAKNYFDGNAAIANLADEIYLSIDWEAAIANEATGEVYMVFNEDGSGAAPLKPFNEYMILAWLCRNAPYAPRALVLWNNVYESSARLPKVTYAGYELLTDGMWPDGNETNILSNFVPQFAFYLCSHFNSRSDYTRYLFNAYRADRYWFSKNTTFPPYVFGTGAGVQPDGYSANNFRQNKFLVASPQILAGYIPFNNTLIENLDQMLRNGIGTNKLPGTDVTVLWRVSNAQPEWKPDNIAGVDWSTMVFGLASHKSVLDVTFFQKNSIYAFPTRVGVREVE